MAFEVFVPRLGWSMDEGVFVEWLKQNGEQVEAGDLLFTLESEKAIQEIEAIDSGILRIPPDGPKEGDTVAVGAVLAYLVESDESAPFEVKSIQTESESKKTESEPAASPAVRRLARELGLNLSQINGTGDAGRISEADARAAAESSGPPQPLTAITSAAGTVPKRQRLSERGLPRISPRAAGVATELGIDWRRLNGSGKSGRIRERDVRAAAESSPITSTSRRHDHGTVKSQTVTPMRRTIAQRMMISQQSTAPVTLTTTADATNLVALHDQFQSSADALDSVVPSYTDFIVKLAADALTQHQQLNSRWSENEIVISPEVRIGIAVDTDSGLVAPVLQNVSATKLREVAIRSRDLIERAHARKLRADELQGGTFTVTNLGAFGIDVFTPIINYPECAILGVGRIAKQPVVVDDQVVVREQVHLSLTFDHRIVDGAPAARFLQTLRERTENPVPWLMS